MGTWVDDDLAYLKANYSTAMREELELRLCKLRGWGAVRTKAKALGLSRRHLRCPNRWTDQQLTFLRENYTSLPWNELLRKVERHPHSIMGKAKELGLSHRRNFYWRWRQYPRKDVDNNLSEAEWGYVAGLIDGEGTIGAYRAKDHHLPRLVLKISNTRSEILDWCKNKLHMSEEKFATAEWNLYAIRTILTNASPYLILKHHLAELALEVVGLIIEKDPYLELNKSRLNEIYMEIRRINKRSHHKDR